MKLRILKGTERGKEIEVTGDVFTIGREADNDLVINETSVSRRHCQLHKEDDSWIVEDLHSMNGVMVNGMKIDGGCELFNQDVIKVYDHELLFIADNAKSVRPKPEKEGSSLPLGMIVKVAALVVIVGLIAFLCMKIFNGKRKPKVIDEIDLTTQVSVPKNNGGESGNTSMLSPEAIKNLNADPVPLQNTESNAQEAANPAANQQTQSQMDEPATKTDAVNLVLVDSIPSGATIFIDKREVGKTPYILRNAEPGRHTLELTLNGYEDFVRQIHVPDQLPGKPYSLTLKAGAVSIETTPSGAWVFEGRQFMGVTPLFLSDLTEGEHELIINGPGCESHKETIEVTAAKGEKLSIPLKSLLGGVEVVTSPPDCTVYVNGARLGITKASDVNPLISSPLVVSSLISGQCVLKVEHKSGVSASASIVIPKGQNLQQRAMLWVPTHKISLVDGNEVVGMLLEQDERGDVALQLPNRKSERYLKPQIANLHELTIEEVQDYISKQGKGRMVSSISGGIGRRDDFTLSAAALSQQHEMLGQSFNTRYANKQICLNGETTMRAKENGLVVVLFGTKVKCIFAQGTSNAEFNAISDAADKKEPITLRGTCEGAVNNVVLLKNCVLVEE